MNKNCNKDSFISNSHLEELAQTITEIPLNITNAADNLMSKAIVIIHQIKTRRSKKYLQFQLLKITIKLIKIGGKLIAKHTITYAKLKTQSTNPLINMNVQNVVRTNM